MDYRTQQVPQKIHDTRKTYPDWSNQVLQSFEGEEGCFSHSLSLSSSSRGTKRALHLSPSSPSPQLLFSLDAKKKKKSHLDHPFKPKTTKASDF